MLHFHGDLQRPSRRHIPLTVKAGTLAKRKRHDAAEIAAKLLKADTLSAKGQTQAEIANTLGISVMTFHRWRKMREQELPRTRAETTRAFDQSVGGDPTSETGSTSLVAQLQLENARLRKLVTDLLLEKMTLEDDQADLHAG
jgi:putative transposase